MLRRATVVALVAGMACMGGAARAALIFSPPGVFGRIDMTKYSVPKAQKGASKAAENAAAKKVDVAYYWVPAGHRLHWPEYCKRYNACELKVEFVSDEWYYHSGPGQGLDTGHDHEH